MKKLLTLLAFLPLVGCSVGNVELTKEAVFCESGGEQFKPGESVPAGDDCNFCICSAEGELGNCSEESCEDATGLANPAAVKCSVDGFSYEIREDADGAQSGVCIDAENKECGDWEYFRGECSLGEAATVDGEVTTEEAAKDEVVNEEPAAEKAAVSEEKTTKTQEPAALTPPLE